MKYTESQVKNIAGQRYFKRNGKRILILTVLCVGWVFLANYMITQPKLWIVIAPAAIVLLNIIWSIFQARKTLWARYKKDPTIFE